MNTLQNAANKFFATLLTVLFSTAALGDRDVSPFADSSREWVLGKRYTDGVAAIIDAKSIGIVQGSLSKRYAVVAYAFPPEIKQSYDSSQVVYLIKETIYDCEARTVQNSYISLYDKDYVLIARFVGPSNAVNVDGSEGTVYSRDELSQICKIPENLILRTGNPELLAPIPSLRKPRTETTV